MYTLLKKVYYFCFRKNVKNVVNYEYIFLS
jgi:hypothetical protein